MYWREMSYHRYENFTSQQQRLEVEYEPENEYIDEVSWLKWIYGEEVDECLSTD